MRFADMSLDVICKWRPSLHIYSEKNGGMMEAGTGGKRGKKIGGNAMARQTFSTGWWVQPVLKVVFCHVTKLSVG